MTTDCTESLADEFTENGLSDVADHLRTHGVEATRQWLDGVIAESAANDDPEGWRRGNLEIARQRLETPVPRTNAERAEHAHRAVLKYEDESSIEECISDLLGDLRHLCDESGYDYAERDRIGYENYLAELGEERRT